MGINVRHITRCALIFATTCCAIYIVITIIVLCGAYGNVKKDNPIMIIGYVSFAHVVTLPFLWVGLMQCSSNKPWIFLVFLILNAVWIIGIVVAIILMSAVLNQRVREEWGSNPLNHFLLFLYFVSAVILEVMVFILHNRAVKSKRDEEPQVTETNRPEDNSSQSAKSNQSPQYNNTTGNSSGGVSTSPQTSLGTFPMAASPPPTESSPPPDSPYRPQSPPKPPTPPPRRRYSTSPRKKRMTKSLHALNKEEPFPEFPDVPSDPIEDAPPQPAPRKKRNKSSHSSRSKDPPRDTLSEFEGLPQLRQTENKSDKDIFSGKKAKSI